MFPSEKDNTYIVQEFDFGDEKLITETIDLLKTVFSNTEFDKNWWFWKYRNNPFGDPLGWYASHNGKLVGVRLATPNRFRMQEDVFSAYQMVDTATHPEYGKKGIFTALTKRAIEKIRSQNSFIFNFPNKNSFPGYISLGWNKIKDLSWYISPTSCFALLREIKNADFIAPSISNRKYINNCCTDWTTESLMWRFKNHPYNKYATFILSKKDFAVYKIRKIKGFSTAVIMMGDSSDGEFFCREFIKYLSKSGIAMISYNGMNDVFENFFKKKIIVARSSVKINYVTRDLPCNLENRIVLELADTDHY